MADTKISAMTPTAELANADLVPAVQGGVNVKVTRAGLLTATPGEAIVLVGNGGAVVSISPTGSVTVIAATGGKLELLSNGAIIDMDASGNVIIIPKAGKVVGMHFTAGFPGDWVGAPVDVWAALDRIARVVSLHGATPIP